MTEHVQVLTDLQDKDRLVDDLIRTADELVGELRVTLSQASAVLRDPPGRGAHGGGAAAGRQ